MKALIDNGDILSFLCKTSKKWGIYFSGTESFEESHIIEDTQMLEVMRAAPWLSKLSQSAREEALLSGNGFLLFDSEEEMFEVYYQTVGDDGPTKNNQYTGYARVYMVTCDSDGEIQTENT